MSEEEMAMTEGEKKADLPVAFALCEVKRLKEMISFVGKAIAAAQPPGGGTWRYGETRTKDSVLEVVYPGIKVNELRAWRKELEEVLEDLQSRVKKANWASGVQAKLEKLEKLDRDIKRMGEEITKNLRIFEDEVENTPDVAAMLESIQVLYVERAFLSYEVQVANLEVQVPLAEG